METPPPHSNEWLAAAHRKAVEKPAETPAAAQMAEVLTHLQRIAERASDPDQELREKLALGLRSLDHHLTGALETVRDLERLLEP